MRVSVLVLLLLSLPVPLLRAAGEPVPEYRLPEGASLHIDSTDEIVADLVREVVEEGARESDEAWRVLGALGRRAAPAVVAALQGTAWFGRSLLMAALAESGVPEVETVLLMGAQDPSWAVRRMAAIGLGREPYANVEDALVRLCDDPSWRVRDAAAHSLRRQASRGRLNRDRAISVLLRLAADPDEDIHLRAVVELGNLRAVEGKTVFLEGFEGDTDDVRDACFRALLGLDDIREDVVAALATALTDRSGSDFLDAAEKYAELTGARILEDETILYKLLQTLRSESTRAARVFEEIGPPAVPVLIEELKRTHGRLSRLNTPGSLDRTVLDIVQNILGKDAAPLLEKILTEWRDAPNARRYAAALARRFHAAALLPTFRVMYYKEGFFDLRASLLQGIAAADPADLPDFLRNAVLSGDFHLQRAAFNILLNREDIGITDALLSAVTEEEDYKLAGKFLRLMYERKSPDLLGAAAGLLGRKDPELRRVGAEWLGYVPERSEVLQLLTGALAREDGRDWAKEEEADVETEEEEKYRRERIGEVRRTVVCALLGSARRAGGEAALPLLRRGAADPNPFVRERALYEASKVRDPGVLALANELLDTETEESPLLEAMKILVSSDAPEAAARATRELAGKDMVRRTRMLRALKEVDAATIPDALLAGLRDGNWEADARQIAVDILTVHGSTEHLSVLSDIAANDPVAEIRSDAVRALGELGFREAAPTLISLLPGPGVSFDDVEDDERLLVEEVILALGYLGPTDAVPKLLDMLEVEWPMALLDTTEDRRHFSAANLIVTSLGRMGDPRAIAPLTKLLFTPELYRFYALLAGSPPRGQANLLGSLVKALVRYPDDELVAAGRVVLDELRSTGDAFRVDERYLNYLGELFSDPRKKGIRRPQPRRDFASLLFTLVRDVVPRESFADLSALRQSVARESDRGRFAEASAAHRQAVSLAEVLTPMRHRRDRHYLTAEGDLLEGLSLMDAGKPEEGMERYREGRDRDAEDPRILNLFAWWLAETGRNLTEALEAAEAAGRGAASDPNHLDTLGWVLFKLGRYEAAAFVLKDAMELDEKRAQRTGDGAYVLPLIIYHYAATAAMADHPIVAGEELIRTIGMDDTFIDRARNSPHFDSLRRKGVFEEAIREGIKSIPK